MRIVSFLYVPWFVASYLLGARVHYLSGCGNCPKTVCGWCGGGGSGVLLWGCSSGLSRCVDWWCGSIIGRVVGIVQKRSVVVAFCCGVVHRGCLGVWIGGVVPLSVGLWELSKNGLWWWRFVVGLFIGVASVCGLVVWFHYRSGCGNCPKTVCGGGVLLWGCSSGLSRCVDWWCGSIIGRVVGIVQKRSVVVAFCCGVVDRGCLGVWIGGVVPLSVGLWELSKNGLWWWRFVVGLLIGVVSVCGLVVWFHYPSGCGNCPKTL